MPSREQDSWSDTRTPDAKSREVAENTMQRLRELYEFYPSQDLLDALHKLEAWRAKWTVDE